jgi:hypothetical protein
MFGTPGLKLFNQISDCILVHTDRLAISIEIHIEAVTGWQLHILLPVHACAKLVSTINYISPGLAQAGEPETH